MNIYEAAKTGQPFAHPDLIGAYRIYHGKYLVHRDCPADFFNIEFMREHFGDILNDDVRESWKLCCYDLLAEYLLSDGWFLVCDGG